MKKRTTYICIFLAILIIILIVLDKTKTQKEIIEFPVEENRTIIRKEDKDFVSNQVLLSFKDNSVDSEIESFFKKIDDVKEYEYLGLNTYVVTLNHDFNSRNELNNYCKKIEQHKEVLYCEANNIILLDDCSKGPC